MRKLYGNVPEAKHRSCVPCDHMDPIDGAIIAAAYQFGPGELLVHLMPIVTLLAIAGMSGHSETDRTMYDIEALRAALGRQGIDLDDYAQEPADDRRQDSATELAPVLASFAPFAEEWADLDNGRQNWYTMMAARAIGLGYRITKGA